MRPEPQLVVELSGNGRCPGRLVSLVLVVVVGVDHRPLALFFSLSSLPHLLTYKELHLACRVFLLASGISQACVES